MTDAGLEVDELGRDVLAALRHRGHLAEAPDGADDALELVGGHLQRERRLVGAGLRRLHPPADGGGGVDGPLVALADPALLDADLDHPRGAGGDGGRDRLPAEPARPHPR